jgi:osmotically-inducible protein OsmY
MQIHHHSGWENTSRSSKVESLTAKEVRLLRTLLSSTTLFTPFSSSVRSKTPWAMRFTRTKVSQRIQFNPESIIMKISNIAIALSSLLLAAGCAYEQRYGYTYGSSHGSEAIVRPTAADRSLEQSVRYEISRYGALAAVAPDVQITCRDGAVTISGSVANERDKQMMDACVRNTSGVLSLDNQLTVMYPATGSYDQSTVYTPAPPPSQGTIYTAPPAVAPPAPFVRTEPARIDTFNVQVQASTDADRDCAQRVIETVRADPAFATQSPTVTVTLNGGRAFIYGTADSRAQRRAIVNAVKRVPGVVQVRDDIRLRNGPFSF